MQENNHIFLNLDELNTLEINYNKTKTQSLIKINLEVVIG